MSAPEAVASTVRGGRGGTPLPGAQHGEAAGWAGRTHDNQHECVAYGLDNIRQSRGVCARRPAERGKDAGRAGQMHDYDLDHIDLSIVTDGQSSTGCTTRTQPSASFTQVLLHILHIHAHNFAETHKHTCMHFYTCCILKSDMLKVHMEHTMRCRVHLCTHMPV